MSATLRLLTARRALAAPRTRPFSTVRVLNAGKESALHSEGRAEEAEAAKQEQLRKQKAGKGEWHDALASDSESIVKADRDEVGSTADTIEKLQKEGEKLAGKKK